MTDAECFIQNEWAVFWSGERIQCPYCKVIRKLKTSDNGAVLHFPIKCPSCQTVLVYQMLNDQEAKQ